MVYQNKLIIICGLFQETFSDTNVPSNGTTSH